MLQPVTGQLAMDLNTPAHPRFDPELSTAENLRRRGLATRPAAGPRPGCRGVVDADGRVLVTGNCTEVNAWMRAQDDTEREGSR